LILVSDIIFIPHLYFVYGCIFRMKLDSNSGRKYSNEYIEMFKSLFRVLIFKLQSSNFKLLIRFHNNFFGGLFYRCSGWNRRCGRGISWRGSFHSGKTILSNESIYYHISHDKELLLKKKQTSCIIKLICTKRPIRIFLQIYNLVRMNN
jgi:hypothetical protein